MVEVKLGSIVLIIIFFMSAGALYLAWQPRATEIVAPAPVPEPTWYDTPPSWYSNPPATPVPQPVRIVYPCSGSSCPSSYFPPSYDNFYGNPILLLYFNNNGGNVVYDSSGNGNNGYLSGGAYLTGSRTARFDGSGYIAFDSAVKSSAPYSVESWVYPDNVWVSENQYIIANGGETRASQGFALYLSPRGICFMTRDPNGIGATAYASGYSGWMHIVGTWDGSIERLYINGNLVSSSYSTNVENGGSWNLQMGNQPQGDSVSSGGYHGYIGKTAMYPYVLSHESVIDLYNNGR